MSEDEIETEKTDEESVSSSNSETKIEVEEIELPSVDEVDEKSRKSQSHSIVLLGRTKMNKSTIAQKIALEIGAVLIETEEKPTYYEFEPGKLYRTSTFNGMINAIKAAYSTGNKIVVDSVTEPLKYMKQSTPWNQTFTNINKPLEYAMKLIKIRGGLIVAHGKYRKTIIEQDELNREGTDYENSVPEGRFDVEGNNPWLSIITGTAILGEVVSEKPNPKVRELMMMISGNHIPKDYYPIKIIDKRVKKFDKVSPDVEGVGYKYLKYLVSNPIK